MNKNNLVIGIIFVIIVTISIYIVTTKINKSESNITTDNSNQVNNNISNNDKAPKEIVSLLEIPVPDSIIFYHNGVQKTFIKETDEFNEIIKLNNKRDSGKLGVLQLVVDIDRFLQNTDMLEYVYQNHQSIYFNLIKDEQLKNDNTEVNWLSVGYDSKVFNQFIYGGLASADELITYLYTLK